MKKRVISATAIMAMLFGLISMPEAKAQVFIDEDMENNQRSGTGGSDMPNIPQLGITLDQYQDDNYTPLGGEVLALGLLGGAYLLGKRHRSKE